MDKELQALLFQQWSNGACLGYVIKAMENLDYQPKGYSSGCIGNEMAF